MAELVLRAATPHDAAWVNEFMQTHWGGEIVVVHNHVYHPAHLPGFVASQQGEIVGLITYTLQDDACEIVSLDSTRPGAGTGAALIAAVRQVARQAGCRRLWLITTNDNLDALRFYQKRGFRLAALYPGAVDAARRIKPTIPATGEYGIPIRDELELEIRLDEEE